MNKIEKTILIILPLLGIIYFIPAVLMGLLGLFETKPFAKFMLSICIIVSFVIYLSLLLTGKFKSRASAWGVFALVILLTIVVHVLFNIIVLDATLY